jgi:HAD superfamily hydrolase (TIGR01490 family)
MKRRIAFFDFDGTITTKDTLLVFIRYTKGRPRFLLGLLLTAPWLVAWKLKLISNSAAKQRLMRHFFGGQALDTFQQQCDTFAAETIPGLIRPKALAEITRLRELGATIVIVSASPDNWIRGFTGRIDAKPVATRLEVRKDPATGADVLTGRFEGANCHGEEKVRRIKAGWSLEDYDEIYAYGDSPGDIPMLGLATVSFYRPFR